MLEGVNLVIKRSNRKTASIYIERDGSVSLYAPEKLSETEINGILRRKEYRIHQYLAKREILNENAIKREAVNGQSYLFLGRNHYLRYSKDVDQLQLDGDCFTAPASKKSDIEMLFRNFYRKVGKSIIVPRVQHYAEMMGLKIHEVSILELKYRWASCSTKKPKVNFHWKVMMAPLSVIDYIIVHELAHVTHKRHDSAFWNEVDKVMPDYRKQVDWLKEFGASLTL
jgi:hypothetical protein